ncbi:MAG: histone methyltransferase set1 [Geoglossum simile]|nr:MAG: histone methyltransferase set1 [Geoglossum simile]
MSRASAGFADFFPTAPSVLQQKQKQAARQRQRARAKPVEPPVPVPIHPETVAATSASIQDDPVESPTLVNGGTNGAGGGGSGEQGTPAQDDNESVQGDILNGVGSASSHTSTVSSVFSATNHPATYSTAGGASNAHTLTPLTNTDSSPPGRAATPPSQLKTTNPNSIPKYDPTYDCQAVDESADPAASMTPSYTPPPPRPTARAEGKVVKGYKITYDPDLDRTATSKERKKRTPVYQEFGEEDDDEPPSDPRLRLLDPIKNTIGKQRYRVALYPVKPYVYDPKTSIGPGPPTQVVVTGFHVLTPVSNITALFSSYGEIAEVTSQLDPGTGEALGICLIRYKDSRATRGGAPIIPAAHGARRAVKEGNGQRVGGTETVRVQYDRDGKRCKKLMVTRMEEKRKEAMVDEMKKRPVEKPVQEPPKGVPQPPPQAPKGPSGKPALPRQDAPWIPTRPSTLIQTKPVLEQIKRDPYIFIAKCYVPVLGSTIAHMKKRLKAHDWKDVMADSTGYYVRFDNSRRGELAAEKCYRDCHMAALFTYVMNMECQPYGNPNYERSPSPERLIVEQREKEAEEMRRKAQELELEEEKKQRAKDIDPSREAMDAIRQEVKEFLLKDVRTKIAAQTLYDYLDPDRHIAKRRKLGFLEKDRLPGIHVDRVDDTLSVGTPDSRAEFSAPERRPLFSSALNITSLPRIRKIAGAANAHRNFSDPFGARKRAAPKKVDVRPLHHRLHRYHSEDEDSDDERRSSFTRDTEDQDSRPISRMSIASDESDDEESMFPPTQLTAGGDAIFDDDDDDDDADEPPLDVGTDEAGIETKSLAPLTTDLAEVKTLDSRRKRKRLTKTIPTRKRLKGNDVRATEDEEIEIIQIEDTQAEHGSSPLNTVSYLGDDLTDPCTREGGGTPDLEVVTTKGKSKKKPKVAKKRKSKLQVFQERELKKQQERQKLEAILAEQAGPEEPEEGIEEEEEEEEEAEQLVVEEVEEEPARAEVEWGVSTEAPRRTVEDDEDIILDLDGWQNLVKDDEDLRFLREVLEDEPVADVGNVSVWAWKQKEIKALNRGGERGVIRTETMIEGYYVPNSTGSARTEGFKKILESEKSKYLPHRIKVQKAREEREARAKNDKDSPSAAEALKAAAAKLNSKSTSRSTRVNNRRLVADMNAQKHVLSGDNDVLRFNQLKKRKKPVKFARSAIHNWGLYAMENITANDMIIEYVGEKVRQQVADMRERRYLKSGIGSSYLFRIDESTVIDATKRGGIARFINHSCTPNCTAKIIKVEGSKRIVIYALRDIMQNEELTYDYKFEREFDSEDRIPCLCGSSGCKGFLN